MGWKGFAEEKKGLWMRREACSFVLLYGFDDFESSRDVSVGICTCILLHVF